MLKRHKKTILWVLIIFSSSLLFFVVRLGIFQAWDVREGELDSIYLVLKELPADRQSNSDLAAGEIEILNITRALYESGVLKDGNKAKAVSYIKYVTTPGQADIIHAEHLVGLQLNAAQYQATNKAGLDDFIKLQIPPGKYLRTSIPRLNLLSLYISRNISLPALEEARLANKIPAHFRLEVYDRQIRFFIPVPANPRRQSNKDKLN